MVLIVDEPTVAQGAAVQKTIVDVEIFELHADLLEPGVEVEDTSGWPAPSARPTTPAFAAVLHALSAPDEVAHDDEIEIDDGLGI